MSDRRTITRKPISKASCPACKKGWLWRASLSRLEEALGHEGFHCDRCNHAVKYVPPAR